MDGRRMMAWTEQDEAALEECRTCIRNCARFHIKPAPYFPLAIRMYELLEAEGMLYRVFED